MSQSYRIYLDACCLNRPFDDQTQPRIALETEAILTILRQCQSGQWKPIASAALEAELDRTPDPERLNNVKAILASAKIKVVSSFFIDERSVELVKLGFSGYDAERHEWLEHRSSTRPRRRPNPKGSGYRNKAMSCDFSRSVRSVATFLRGLYYMHRAMHPAINYK